MTIAYSLKKGKPQISQVDTHGRISPVGRRWTQEGLLLTGSWSLVGLAKNSHGGGTGARPQASRPLAQLSFSLDCPALISCPAFPRCLHRAGLGIHIDSDRWPVESPGRGLWSHYNMQVKGRSYICKPEEASIWGRACLLLCSCVHPFCCHHLPQTCHKMGSCQLGRPLPAVLFSAHFIALPSHFPQMFPLRREGSPL